MASAAQPAGPVAARPAALGRMDVAALRHAPALAFADAGARYWCRVFPLARRELAGWRGRAERIGDAGLRADARAALRKESNLEGAAAFATFAPAGRRAIVVRASLAFQAAYDYLDVLSERPGLDAPRLAARLNEALPRALSPARSRSGREAARGFYATYDDGGYLAALLDACGQALVRLPGLAGAADGLRRAAERAARFQALNVAVPADDGVSPLQTWASTQLDRDRGLAESGLAWWEAAAAAGSSLGVHALIAAAAREDLDTDGAAAIERAYFPAIGALHSLLDQLVDRDEDARFGQPNITRCYGSSGEAAAALRGIAARARRGAKELDAARRHAVRLGGHSLLLAAMVGNYLALPEAASDAAAPACAAILEEVGPLARASIPIFKARRRGERR